MNQRDMNNVFYAGNDRAEQRNGQGRLSVENGCSGYVEHHCHHHTNQGCVLPLILLGFLLFGNNHREC